ncbi:Protein of unknown function [Gryllus bimaculatus]|nr:Protein of unknown function [Gryllus bimaculatus]
MEPLMLTNWSIFLEETVEDVEIGLLMCFLCAYSKKEARACPSLNRARLQATARREAAPQRHAGEDGACYLLPGGAASRYAALPSPGAGPVLLVRVPPVQFSVVSEHNVDTLQSPYSATRLLMESLVITNAFYNSIGSLSKKCAASADVPEQKARFPSGASRFPEEANAAASGRTVAS